MQYQYDCTSCGHAARIIYPSSDSTVLFCPFCGDAIDIEDAGVELDYRDEFESEFQDPDHGV